jgi:hypothetical protein
MNSTLKSGISMLASRLRIVYWLIASIASKSFATSAEIYHRLRHNQPLATIRGRGFT